jgi:hypothetical protein
MDEELMGAGTGAGPAASGASTGAAAAATQPSTSNSTATAPASAGTAGSGASGAASAASSSATNGAATGATGAAAAFSLREQLGSLGVDANQFQSDADAWKYLQGHLTQQQQTVQQATDLARYGQYYLANRQKFEQQVAQPETAAKQAEKPLWQVPEWNPQWESFLLKDPTTGRLMADQFGNPQVIPGADPGLALKYSARRQWERDTLQKLVTDPMAVLEPLLERFVGDRFGKLYEEKSKAQQGTGFVNDFLSPAKSPWLYQLGPDGRPVVNQFSGTPALSPAGQVFKGYAEHLDTIGVKDPQAAATIAQMLTEHAAMKAKLAGGGATTETATAADPNAVNEAMKTQAVRSANGANRIANRHPAATPAAPQAQPGRPRARLGERLRAALKNGGVS